MASVSRQFLVATFPDEVTLRHAARRLSDAGFHIYDAYTPYPVHGLSELIGVRHSRLPLVALAGGVAGCMAALAMQFYMAVIDWPLNVGGKPLHSWPAFIPVTFETTILVAALAAVFGMLALNGLPQPYHPVFNVPRFALASRNRFFLCIESRDPKFDLEATRQFLERLGPREVTTVAH